MKELSICYCTVRNSRISIASIFTNFLFFIQLLSNKDKNFYKKILCKETKCSVEQCLAKTVESQMIIKSISFLNN